MRRCYILIFSFEPCSRIASRSSMAQKSCGPLENCCLIVLSHSSAVVLLVTWQGPSRIKFTQVKWVTLFSLLFSSWKTFEKIPLILDTKSQKLYISLLSMPVSWEIPSLWKTLYFTQALTTLGFLLLVSVDCCFANWQNPCCSLLLTSCKFSCAHRHRSTSSEVCCWDLPVSCLFLLVHISGGLDALRLLLWSRGQFPGAYRKVQGKESWSSAVGECRISHSQAQSCVWASFDFYISFSFSLCYISEKSGTPIS